MTASLSQRVHVSLDDRSYDIVIGSGVLAQAGALIKEIIGTRPLILVSDETVAPIYRPKLEAALAAAGIAAPPAVLVPAGEESKSLESYVRAAESILALGVDRKTVILALGGGVVGDLAGFLAATLLRGIDFIQIPTSLLAQVDSSVGGKTGIDSAHGKNLIGAFHQPLLVVADTDTLITLPSRELKAGYAEVVKYGLLGDAAFFEWLDENGASVLDGDPVAQVHAIAACCKAKAEIVAADEREGGPRALLNLGHTFGHALEVESGFGALSNGQVILNHGEAVSIGMAMAFDLSVRLGFCPANDLMRMRAHLRAHGLPVSPPRDVPLEAHALIRRMQGDKKAEGGRLTFVLVNGIGQAFVARDVASSVVEIALTHALAA
ncbi:MAG: 3-dehydroquinate synthase [Rhodospirillales bacterium]|nr:3-dehydroquinate synthase [Rhodospirillales bacterium]